MNNENLDIFYQALIKYWINEDADAEEFHTSILKLAQKKGDLSEPKNWRPIQLLDSFRKLIAAIIAHRLDEYLVKEIGLQTQHGFSSSRGCPDATSSLKIALEQLRYANQEAFVLFVDLVKAFDSVNREMLWKILSNMGVPDSLINVIKKAYTDITITGKVNGVKFDLESTSGVQQGCPLSPVLFLFAMQAVLESMDKVWPSKKPELHFLSSADGTPTGHISKRDNATKTDTMRPIDLYNSLFADDAAFIFLTREDLIEGTKCIIDHFRAFGLEVHLGKHEKNGEKATKSKTEFMHFPARKRILTEGKKKATTIYESTEADKADITLENNRFVSWTDQFKYLGSIIHSSLTDAVDIRTRRKKAHQAFGTYANIYCNKKLKLRVRVAFYKALVVNVALWGCEAWSLSAVDFRDFEVLQNKCIRRMCHVSPFDQKNYHVTCDDLRKRTNLPKIESVIRARITHFLDRIACAPHDRITRQVISCQVARPEGHSFKGCPNPSLQTSYRKVLESAGLCPNSSAGDLKEWMPRLARCDKQICDQIDKHLELKKGTYSKGRHRPCNPKKQLNKNAIPFFPLNKASTYATNVITNTSKENT